MFERIASPPDENLRAILAHWFTRAELSGLRFEEIPGGKSHSRFWRVAHEQTRYCLRSDPIVDRAEIGTRNRVHAFIEQVWKAGFRKVPLPHRTLRDEFFIEKKAIWELLEWLPGESTRSPTRVQILAAVECLARFHLVAAMYEDPLRGHPRGLKQRAEILEELSSGLLNEIQVAVRGATLLPMGNLVQRIADQVATNLPLAQSIIHSARTKVPLQWCLFDCHIQNILFVGEEVSGIVDLGLAGMGSISQDIARLVGSSIRLDQSQWVECLAVYQKHRSLSKNEIQLVLAFHVSGIIVAAANWLRWRFVENHPAADVATTQERLNALEAQLSAITETQAIFRCF